jgi:hypothetical protein
MTKSKHNTIFILTTLAVLVIAGGVWFMFFSENDSADGGPVAIKQGFQLPGNPLVMAPEREEQSKTTLTEYKAGRRTTYSHQRLGFSFDMPEGFSIGEFDNPVDESETVLVQKGDVGFQLVITPFDEDVILTEEVIRGDLPDIVIEQPIQIQVNNAIALAFISESESLGKTREVWWIYRGHLYQISTYTEFDEVMVEILESWSFK